MNRKHPEKRGAFSGKLGYVLSAAGASEVLEIYGDFRIRQQNRAEEVCCSCIFCWH